MNLEKILCCPHCSSSLDFSKSDPHCLKCNLVFNSLGKNSFNMFPDPLKATKNSHSLMREFLAEIDAEIETLGLQIKNSKLLLEGKRKKF